ncbi:MAG: hypothetical protein J7507_11920 [Pseudoxanthomonas sp.]|nr:hypothetical protein [Pseudoxanthomonas sp.]
MATLPTLVQADPTLEAVKAAIENDNLRTDPRGYLGMSFIGHECERLLWGQFRFCPPAGGGFDAKALLNFEDGHRTEDVMAAHLRSLPGVKLHTADPSTGRQFGFSDLGGHFRGHIDGAIQGIYQAPQTWHIWENKASEAGPAALEKAKAKVGEKAALREWHPIYYAQAVLYMHYGEMTRHYLTCTSPGGRLPWTSVRTNADKDTAERLIAKADRIIFSADPLPKLSEDPAHWKCKGCALSSQCHGTALPRPSCRTCLHAAPEREGDGRWSCARWGEDIPADVQRAGCSEHLYIPALLKRWGSVEDASEAEGWVEYRAADGLVFRNGPWGLNSFTSRELHAASPVLLRSDEFMAIRGKHAGVIVEGDSEDAREAA